MRSVQIGLCAATFAIATVGLLAPPSTALAQNAAKPNTGKTNSTKPNSGNVGGGLQIAEASGTMQAMIQNQIKILAEDKAEHVIVLTDQTLLQYRGTAEPDFLMPGLLVRFSAELTQSGIVEAPLNELEVFTYSQSRRTTPEQMREQTAGVYQVGNEAGNLKKADTKKAEPKKPEPKKTETKKTGAKETSQPAASPSGAQTYRVVGRVLGSQAGKVFVQAGSVRVQVELAPKAVINVTARDTTFLQTGDKIKVSGLRNAAQEMYIQAENIEIVAAKPLSAAEGNAGVKNAKSSKAKTKAAKGGTDKGGTDKADKADDKKTSTGKSGAKSTNSN